MAGISKKNKWWNSVADTVMCQGEQNRYLTTIKSFSGRIAE
nr:MAG TPA: hypothetical protein [Caudoviricetes sp.]